MFRPLAGTHVRRGVMLGGRKGSGLTAVQEKDCVHDYAGQKPIPQPGVGGGREKDSFIEDSWRGSRSMAKTRFRNSPSSSKGKSHCAVLVTAFPTGEKDLGVCTIERPLNRRRH